MKKRIKREKSPAECSGCKAAKVGAIFVTILLATLGIFSDIVIHAMAKRELMTSFNYELRSAVEVAVGAVNTVYSQYQDGKLSQSDARNLALTTLRNINWNDSRRGFWALEEDGTVLVVNVHDSAIGTPAAGDNLWDQKDANGKNYQQDFIAAAKNGGGYVEYAINNDGLDDFIGYAMPTDFGFIVDASYNMNYFNTAAYPETRLALWWSVLFLAGIGLIAIGCYTFSLVRVR